MDHLIKNVFFFVCLPLNIKCTIYNTAALLVKNYILNMNMYTAALQLTQSNRVSVQTVSDNEDKLRIHTRDKSLQQVNKHL